MDLRMVKCLLVAALGLVIPDSTHALGLEHGVVEVEACAQRGYGTVLWASGPRLYILTPSSLLQGPRPCESIRIYPLGHFEGESARYHAPASLADFVWLEVESGDGPGFSQLEDLRPLPLGSGPAERPAFGGKTPELGRPWVDALDGVVAIEAPEAQGITSDILPNPIHGPGSSSHLLLFPPNLYAEKAGILTGKMARAHYRLQSLESTDKANRILESRRLLAQASARSLIDLGCEGSSCRITLYSDLLGGAPPQVIRRQSQLLDSQLTFHEWEINIAELDAVLPILETWLRIQDHLFDPERAGRSHHAQRLITSLEAMSVSSELQGLVDGWVLALAWQSGLVSQARIRASQNHDWALYTMSQGAYRPEVEKILSTRLASAEGAGDSMALGVIHRTFGQYRLGLGDVEGAKAHFSKALAYYDPHIHEAFVMALRLDLLDVSLQEAVGERRRLLKVVDGYQSFLEGNALDKDLELTFRAQHALAKAYSELPFEAEGEWVEDGIRLALAVKGGLDPKTSPLQWAEIHKTLAYLYQIRSIGDWHGRIPLAIDAYETALRIYDATHFPRHHAQIQLNLATAWLNRMDGNRASHYERAMEGLAAAETLASDLDDKALLATISNNRGMTYLFDGANLTVKSANLASTSFQRAMDYAQDVNHTGLLEQTQANHEIARYYYKAAKARKNGVNSGRAAEALADAYLIEGLRYREWILLTQGVDRFEQAEALYLTAIRRVPEAALFHHKLAVVRWKKLDLAGALEAQEAAKALDSESLFIDNWYRFLSAQRMLVINPNDMEAHMILGRVNLELGDASAALASYDAAAKVAPDRAEPWVEMTRVHMSLNDYEQAHSAINQATEIEGDDFDARAIGFAIAHEFTFDFHNAHGHARRMYELDHEGIRAIEISYLQTFLTSGQGPELLAEGAALLSAKDLGDEERLVLATLLWLAKVESNRRSRRQWKAVTTAFEHLEDGSPMTWGWTGVRQYLMSNWQGDDLEMALAVIDLVEAGANPERRAALSALGI